MIPMQNCVFLMLLKIEMSKFLIDCQELMKRGMQNGTKLVNVNVDYIQVFVTINNVGTKINADAKAKN